MKTAEKPRTSSPVLAPRPQVIHLALSPTSKIAPPHLDRLAIVYVRQSSQKQVLENRESTERQYNFAEQAVAFGWPRDRVLTIEGASVARLSDVRARVNQGLIEARRK